MTGDEMGETESTGLRNERSQASDLHDDSAVKQRANLTEQARELSRERERDGQRSGRGMSTKRDSNKLEGRPGHIHIPGFPSAPPLLLTEWMVPRQEMPFFSCLQGVASVGWMCFCSITSSSILLCFQLFSSTHSEFISLCASLTCCFIGVSVRGVTYDRTDSLDWKCGLFQAKPNIRPVNERGIPTNLKEM